MPRHWEKNCKNFGLWKQLVLFTNTLKPTGGLTCRHIYSDMQVQTTTSALF